MVGGDKSKGKHVAKECKEDQGDNPEFILTHFPQPPLRKQFDDNFMSRSVIPPYFVNLSNLENLEICDKSLCNFLISMGWKNVLVVKERYYENLVKLFYLNMVIFLEFSNRIAISVGRIHIEFDVTVLNHILRTPNEGLELLSVRKCIFIKEKTIILHFKSY